MKKPTEQHTQALLQQIYLLRNAKAGSIEPKFIRSLERDMKLIQEVRDMLFHAIENPTLPFHPEPTLESNPNLDAIEADIEAGNPAPSFAVQPMLNQIEDEPDEAI